MGRDKALLPWQGSTLLDHAIARLSAVCGDVRILCGPAPRYQDRGRPLVVDAIPDGGPLAGIAAGLESAGDAAGVYLGVDLPLVPIALLAMLAAMTDADAIVPVTPGGPEPLCAVYGAGCRDAVRARLAAGDRRMTSFWPDVRVRTVGRRGAGRVRGPAADLPQRQRAGGLRGPRRRHAMIARVQGRAPTARASAQRPADRPPRHADGGGVVRRGGGRASRDAGARRPTAGTRRDRDGDHAPAAPSCSPAASRSPCAVSSRRPSRTRFTDARGATRVHDAMDIMAPRGTAVVAVDGGTVSRLGNSGAGGITVYQLDEAGRYGYYYAHLDRLAAGLAEGQAVRRGDVLGYVGTTGNAPASAPHLHFAIYVVADGQTRWGGRPVNPYPLWRRSAD